MKKSLLFIAILAPIVMLAQIKFEAGNFTGNNNNTTNCFIKNLAWKNTPDSFEYKLSENGEIKTALLKDVASFEVGGYQFTRFIVDIDRSEKSIQSLTSDKVFHPENTTIFLKILVEGTINLYSYEDGNLVKYFISTGNHENAKQLLYKQYLKDSSILENNLYKQELINIMRDEGYSITTFERLQYNKESLSRLIIKYNTDKGTVTDHTQTQNKTSFNFKVTASTGLASLKTSGAVYRYGGIGGGGYSTVNYNFGNAIVPGFGFEAECVLPFNNNKWSLFVNPSLQFYNKTDDITTTYGGTTNTSTWSFKYNFIEIPFGARHYMFLNTNSKVYLEAAYTLAVLLKSTSIERGGVAIYDASSSSGLAIGTGFTYKERASIGFRYAVKRELLQYNVASASYSSIGIILGYKIF
ncbi:hypothetical protein [Flavobacterium psychrotrophum]|uniref:hypothetical protein n=1 Tax=Flavobacterium psychrotrophum TaxID=2294119 RepID=UPI000E311DCE|nr:hypothetical protein [Flavobacterium psychrotrophum]